MVQAYFSSYGYLAAFSDMTVWISHPQLRAHSFITDKFHEDTRFGQILATTPLPQKSNGCGQSQPVPLRAFCTSVVSHPQVI